MNNVFKSETYRLLREKGVWSMAAALAACAAGSFALLYFLSHLPALQGAADAAGEAGQLAGFFDGFASVVTEAPFRILFVIIAAGLVTRMYSSGVMKQIVSCGIPREQFILGQFASFTVVFTCAALAGAVAFGFSRVLLNGTFGFASTDYVRLALSLIGMVLVAASLSALYLLISHLTGSMGPAIAAGMLVELGASSIIGLLAAQLKMEALNTYWINNVQAAAIAETGTIGNQLLNMGILAVYTAVLTAVCILVFKKKEIK